MRLKSLFLSSVVLLALPFAASAHETGTFPASLTGCSTPVPASSTGTVSYVKDTETGLTTLIFPSLHCLSNTFTASITGLPLGLRPVLNTRVPALFNSYGAVLPGQMGFTTNSGTIALYVYDPTDGHVGDAEFATSGTKGLFQAGLTVTYLSSPVP